MLVRTASPSVLSPSPVPSLCCRVPSPPPSSTSCFFSWCCCDKATYGLVRWLIRQRHLPCEPSGCLCILCDGKRVESPQSCPRASTCIAQHLNHPVHHTQSNGLFWILKRQLKGKRIHSSSLFKESLHHGGDGKAWELEAAVTLHPRSGSGE